MFRHTWNADFRLLIYVSAGLLTTAVVRADVVQSVADGNWSDAAGTWDPHAPGAGDEVTIKATHTIRIGTATTAKCKSLSIEATGDLRNLTETDNIKIDVESLDNAGIIATDNAIAAGNATTGYIEINFKTTMKNSGTIKTGNGKDADPDTSGHGSGSGHIEIKGQLGGASSLDNSGTLETGGAGRGALVTDPAKDAGNGGYGGYIIVDFTSITKNGVIRTGNGGDGGTVFNDAMGNRIQKPGGRGGSSAEIRMWSRGDVVTYNLEGEIRTGRGGRGGSTTANQLGIKGGDGGNSGQIRQFAIGASPFDNPKIIEVNAPGSLIVGDRGGEGSGSAGQDGKRGKRGQVALIAYSVDKAKPSKLTLGPTSSIDCGSLSLWAAGYITFSLAGLRFEAVKISGQSDPPEQDDPIEAEIAAGCETVFETRDGNNPPAENAILVRDGNSGKVKIRVLKDQLGAAVKADLATMIQPDPTCPTANVAAGPGICVEEDPTLACVPALSTWGMVALAMAVLCAGTLVIRRRCSNEAP